MGQFARGYPPCYLIIISPLDPHEQNDCLIVYYPHKLAMRTDKLYPTRCRSSSTNGRIKISMNFRNVTGTNGIYPLSGELMGYISS